MPEPLEVVWTTKGMKGVLTELKTVSKAFQDAQQSADNAGGGSRSGGGRSGGSGNGSKRPPSAPPLPAYIRATMTKQDRLNQLLQQAQQAGHTPAQSALQAKIDKMNNAGSFGGRLQSLIASTRIGGGGGMGGAMPLVGRLAALAGEGAEGGPIGMIAVAATAAAAAIYALADKAAEAANKFSALEFTSGSQGIGAARLKSVGGAIGLDEAGIGAMAEAFHAKITDDPTGRAFAPHLGLTAGGHGPYGEQDYGKELLQGIEGLRKITDFAERERVARATGLTGALGLTKLSDSQWEKTKGDAAATSKIFDPDFARNAADFESSMGRLGTTTSNLEAAIGKSLLPMVTNLANGMADAIQKISGTANDHPDAVKGALGIFNPAFWGVALGEAFRNKFLHGEDDPAVAATNANTAATNANTSALGQPGVYGNGPRTGNAIPAGVAGEFLRHGLEKDGFHFGAF